MAQESASNELTQNNKGVVSQVEQEPSSSFNSPRGSGSMSRSALEFSPIQTSESGKQKNKKLYSELFYPPVEVGSKAPSAKTAKSSEESKKSSGSEVLQIEIPVEGDGNSIEQYYVGTEDDVQSVVQSVAESEFAPLLGKAMDIIASQNKRDTSEKEDKIHKTEVVLSKLDTNNKNTRSINLLNWIKDSEQKISVMSDYSRDFFNAAVASGEEAYQKWLAADSYEKAMIKPTPITDKKYDRIKNFVSIIIRNAVNLEFQTQLLSQDKTTAEETFYLVFRRCSPGAVSYTHLTLPTKRIV